MKVRIQTLELCIYVFYIKQHGSIFKGNNCDPGTPLSYSLPKVTHMDVSKNRGGPPKWMVKIMENPIIKIDDLGGFPYIFGNTHIFPLNHGNRKGNHPAIGF